VKLLLWEAWSYLQVPLFWWLFRRYAKREVLGDIVAGTLFGLFFECATEPLWDYHFHLTFFKDIPVSVPLGWGVMYAQVCWLSELMYRRVLKAPGIRSGDKRVFLFDVLAGLLIGFPLETIGYRAGIWEYRALDWSAGTVPFFGMPWELLFGYALTMMVAPSFVRQWQGAFEAER
jgi:hypothetical protein